jgi:benzoate-CoA ligase
MRTAAALGVPERFNAAAYFVDRHLAEGRGDRIAIECGDARVTYAELAERVNRCGDGLRRTCGVQRGERVALLLLDGPSFFYAFFGAMKVGAVPIPLNTMWKPADYAFALADSGARVLVVSEPLRPKVDAHCAALSHVIVDGGAGDEAFEALLGRGRPALEPADVHRDDPAFWLYSSGSTGGPKGCVHLHHDMVVCAELFAKGVLGIREDDRCFSGAKLFFAYGLGNAGYFPLAVGGTSILWPGAPAPADVYRVIERHRPTLFFFVPTGYAMLLAHADQAARMDSIRLAVSAGEALPPALGARFRERFGIDILDGIGSTETLHMFISNRPGAIRPGSSGLIVDGYDAAILDDDRRPVGSDVIGNLWISGDSICDCYWNQPQKTAATIADGWIRTGDKFSQGADGYFWYAGRSDDMMKVGGQWVSPAEVEHALAEHDAVHECAVVGRPDADALQKPMAFVVLRRGYAPTPELAAALQQFVRGRLADYKRPRWVEFVDELPKTATGKIQRFRLRERIANTSGGRTV